MYHVDVSPPLAPARGRRSSYYEIQHDLSNSSLYLSDICYVSQYDPHSLQYMLDFFRHVAQTIPTSPPSPSTAAEHSDAMSIEPMQGSARDMLQDRAGIIVLREDLDFYAIPPRRDIEQPDMIEVKRAAGRALLKQDGIFSGLRKSEEPGTTEQHLIEMLTAGYVPGPTLMPLPATRIHACCLRGHVTPLANTADTHSGFNHDDRWGHRGGEPNKAVICSIALARLRTDIKGNDLNSNAVGMAQKLLLFWRKPARRCWWEGVELDDVEGVEGKLKVWIRRVWTLEMVSTVVSPSPSSHHQDCRLLFAQTLTGRLRRASSAYVERSALDKSCPSSGWCVVCTWPYCSVVERPFDTLTAILKGGFVSAVFACPTFAAVGMQLPHIKLIDDVHNPLKNSYHH